MTKIINQAVDSTSNKSFEIEQDDEVPSLLFMSDDSTDNQSKCDCMPEKPTNGRKCDSAELLTKPGNCALDIPDGTECVPGQPHYKPAEGLFEKPLDEPTECVFEKPLDEPPECVFEKPLDEPTECVFEKPLDEPKEYVFEKPLDEPPECVFEKPLDEPTECVFEKPLDEPKEYVFEKPLDEPPECVFEKPLDEPTECVFEKPLDEPKECVFEKPHNQSVDCFVEKRLNQPEECLVEKPLNQQVECFVDKPLAEPIECVFEKPAACLSEKPLIDPAAHVQLPNGTSECELDETTLLSNNKRSHTGILCELQSRRTIITPFSRDSNHQADYQTTGEQNTSEALYSEKDKYSNTGLDNKCNGETRAEKEYNQMHDSDRENIFSLFHGSSDSSLPLLNKQEDRNMFPSKKQNTDTKIDNNIVSNMLVGEEECKPSYGYINNKTVHVYNPFVYQTEKQAFLLKKDQVW